MATLEHSKKVLCCNIKRSWLTCLRRGGCNAQGSHGEKHRHVETRVEFSFFCSALLIVSLETRVQWCS